MATYEEHNANTDNIRRSVRNVLDYLAAQLPGDYSGNESLEDAVEHVVCKLDRTLKRAVEAEIQLAKYADNPNNIVRIEGYDGPLVPESRLTQAAREGYERALTDVAIAMQDVKDEPGKWKRLSGWIEGRQGWVSL